MIERRSVLKKLFATVVGIAGIGMLAKAESKEAAPEKVVLDVVQSQNTPLMGYE